MWSYNFITVEGNIGAGKTTLCHLLAKYAQAKLVLEQFADNPFLPKFYKDPTKYGFQLELSFLATRFKQLKEMLNTKDIFNTITISDYLFIKSKLFAKVNLPEDEYHLYETLFDFIYPNLPAPDLLIYLHTPLQKLKQNITTRNRDYEQQIPETYLINIEDAYLQFIKSNTYKTLIIDTTHTDFLNNKTHFDKLIEYLHTDYENGCHYLTF